MSNRKSVVIPKGWRKLKPHECPQIGDKWNISGLSAWSSQSINTTKRADTYHDGIIHIRRIKQAKRKTPVDLLDGVKVLRSYAGENCAGVPAPLWGARLASDRKCVVVWESDWRKIVAAIRRNGL